MAKLSRSEIAAHRRALEILAQDGPLSRDQVYDVLENFHEGANTNSAALSAFFTPVELAQHAAIEVVGEKILDLCSGIGCLSAVWAMSDCWADFAERQKGITLIELNPDYAAVAKKLMPNARVIVGSMYDPAVIGQLAGEIFDTVLSNPPFGSFSKAGQGLSGPRYRGGKAHYDAIDIASDLGKHGVWVLPQAAVPFAYSGRKTYTKVENQAYERFREATECELVMNCGIDTQELCTGFRGTTILCEIALCDFEEARARRAERLAPPPATLNDDLPLFSQIAA